MQVPSSHQRLFVCLACVVTLGNAQALAQDCAAVVARFRQTSVSISVEGVHRDTGAIRRAKGSGVIVSDKGHVLTNQHLTSFGSEFVDLLFRGSIGSSAATPGPMRLIDSDPVHDLALLQFNNTATSYQAAPLGSIEAAATGASVCTFGYPLDVEFRPTRGTLGGPSGPGGWWTLDTPTNEGESGSPVFSALGALLGVRVAGRDDAKGIYYMVPINLAARLLAVVPKMPANRLLLDGRAEELRSAARRAIQFPNAVPTSRNPPTMLQGMLVNSAPLKLFDVLARYDGVDLSQIPDLGVSLESFFRKYYEFEQVEAQLERESLDRISKTVRVRFSEGWRIYLRYVLLRFSGQPAQQLGAGNNFLNYEITWDDCERVYQELARDAMLSKSFAAVFAQHQAFLQDIERLNALSRTK